MAFYKIQKKRKANDFYSSVARWLTRSGPRIEFRLGTRPIDSSLVNFVCFRSKKVP